MKRLLALSCAILLGPLPAGAASQFKNMAVACSAAVTAPEKAIKACDWLLDVRTLPEQGRASVHFLRGIANFIMEDWETSRRDFSNAIRIHPRNPPAYVARGSVYFQMKQYERAIRDFDLAIKIQPNLSEAFNNRANTQVKIGKHESALGDYEKAIRFRSKFITAFIDRSMAYRRSGEHEAADEDIRKAIRISDGSAEAYNALARHFATADDPRARDGELAIQFSKRAVALQPIAEFVETLAAAYAENGRFNDAVREQKRAIELYESRKSSDSETLEADLKSRLELYRSGQAYRESSRATSP